MAQAVQRTWCLPPITILIAPLGHYYLVHNSWICNCVYCVSSNLDKERTIQVLMGLFSGLIFGSGLIISGMIDPSKVIGFFDFSGKWGPSLTFVLGGEILVGAFAFRFTTIHSHAMLGRPIKQPTTQHIGRRLVLVG